MHFQVLGQLFELENVKFKETELFRRVFEGPFGPDGVSEHAVLNPIRVENDHSRLDLSE